MPRTVVSVPSRWTVIATGVPLWAPTSLPTWSRCSVQSPVSGRPSTASTRSPGFSVVAAGVPFSIAPTTSGGSMTPFAQNRPARIANASAMLTTGPAPITKIRFHTGWR